MAVAWVMAQGPTSCPSSARASATMGRIERSRRVDAHRADFAEIEAAGPKGAAKGDRYPPQAMAHLDSEKRG